MIQQNHLNNDRLLRTFKTAQFWILYPWNYKIQTYLILYWILLNPFRENEIKRFSKSGSNYHSHWHIFDIIPCPYNKWWKYKGNTRAKQLCFWHFSSFSCLTSGWDDTKIICHRQNQKQFQNYLKYKKLCSSRNLNFST